MVFLVFLLVARIFFFFFVTFLLFLPVVLLMIFFWSPDVDYYVMIRLSRSPNGNWSAEDFADILYPNALIRELIFSLTFLWRLPLDSSSQRKHVEFLGYRCPEHQNTPHMPSLVPKEELSLPSLAYVEERKLLLIFKMQHHCQCSESHGIFFQDMVPLSILIVLKFVRRNGI